MLIEKKMVKFLFFGSGVPNLINHWKLDKKFLTSFIIRGELFPLLSLTINGSKIKLDVSPWSDVSNFAMFIHFGGGIVW